MLDPRRWIPDTGQAVLTVAVVLLLISQITVAVTVLHDFESSDSLDPFAGDTGSAKLKSDDVYEGTQALKMDVEGAQRAITTTNQSIAPGSRFIFYGRPDGGMVFGVGNETGWTGLTGYTIHLDNVDDGLFIVRRDPTSAEVLLRNASVESYAEYYKFIVDWGTDGTIALQIYDTNTGNRIFNGSVKDSTYTATGYGFFAEWGGYIDNVSVVGNAQLPGSNDNTVQGSVTTTSGDAITGATVSAYNPAATSIAGETITNTSGEYNLTLANGTYTFQFVEEGYAATTKSVSVAGPTTVDAQLTTLENTTGTDVADSDGDGTDDVNDPDDDNDGIPDTDDLDDDGDGIPDSKETVLKGTVTNASGFVIPGATIAAEVNGTTRTTTTNATGKYRLRLNERGTADVQADAAGFAPSSNTTVTLDGGTVQQSFVLTRSGRPVIEALEPNASTAYQQNYQNVDLTVRASDPDGDNLTATFYLLNNASEFVQVGSSSLTNGEATVTVTGRPGRNQWYAVVRDETGAQTTSDVARFRLPGLVRVRSVSNLSLVTHTTVTARIDNRHAPDFQPITRTVSDGIVPLENVPNQSLVVNVSASGYQNRTLRIPDPSRLYDTALVPTSDGTVGDGPTPDLQGADLYGVVKTDRGRRVPNASVRVENATTSWTTTTNATGWYAVADAALAAGDYNVTVTAPNASLRDASGTVTLGSGRTQLNVTLATAGAPVFFPDSAAPTGATAARDVTLEVAVDDPEFGTAGGETVTVEFFVDGSSVGTDTLSSAGVASTSTTLPADAQVNWSATATDSFGATSQLDNQTIRTAGTIVLRNETDSGTKLSNLANASVTYYGDTASETRTIGDETLNLSGIPTGTPTVAQFRADGYHTREVALFNLSSQQTAYLLSTDVDSSTVVFELVSYDAAFQPEQTSLILQRPLELNNTTAYRTVASGPFGATAEYQAELETGARYRILVRNDVGETRTVGPFTPRADTRQTVRITPTGDVNVTGRGARVTVRPAVRSLTAREQTVSVELSTPGDVVLRRATITVRAGGSLLERPQVFATGRTDLNVNLSGRAGQTLSVEVVYETADGVSDTVAVEYAIRRALSNDYSLLNVVGTVTGRLPSGHVQPFTSAVALFVTVFGSVGVAARTRAGSEVVALVAVGLLGGFSVIGWVGFDVVFATAVGAIVFAALERGI